MCVAPASTTPGSATSLPPLTAGPDQVPLSSCPLLQQLMAEKGLHPKGIYTNRDAAQIFRVSTRTVQDWIRCGKLQARDLPGRGRFLSQDLELFLQHSVKPRCGGAK